MFKLDEEHYNPDGSPKKCRDCGCTEFDYKVVDSLDGHVCEFVENCSNCKAEVSYWAYGNYHWEYTHHEVEDEPNAI